MARRTSSKRAGAPGPTRAGAALLSHDIKNLAGRLAALCQNLNDRFDDPLFRRSTLALLDDTVSHLRRMAADVHDRDGRIMVKLRLDVNSILEGAVLDTRPDLAGEVRLEERYRSIPSIWGDAYLLRRAFACGIENALEAMKGKGRLSVETKSRSRAGRRSVHVEIADDGPGMSDEFMKLRLGTPFSSTKDDGLGLGVYTMAQVAAIHGGSVRIFSAPGRGARVRFTLPAIEG
jgi:two-component system C4-dicarboxylate transport sensor histidine kinase DctB